MASVKEEKANLGRLKDELEAEDDEDEKKELYPLIFKQE